MLPIDGDSTLIFNSKNCSLAELEQEYVDVLRKLGEHSNSFSSKELSILGELLDAGFVVEDNIDEIENLRFQHFHQKYNNEYMSITIAPTMDCNFACKYCFEEHKKNVMSDKVQTALLAGIADNLCYNAFLDVNWYGGEPLLAIDIVESMSKKIKEIVAEKNSKVRFSMVTNGYLLSKEMVERLVHIGLESIQITIDGSKDVHNSRRVLRDGVTGSFDRVLQGIKEAINGNLNVVVRINIDKDNYPSIQELLRVFLDNGINKVKIALGHVLPYTYSCEYYKDKCFTKEEYSNVVLDVQNMMISSGFENESIIYPSQKLSYCSACNANSFLIDPEGNLYKCWCDVGNIEEAFGTIFDYDINSALESNYLKWINSNPFTDKECLECKLLPICMGGCPKIGQQSLKGKNCDLWKYNIEDMIKCTYNYYCNL